ncbi:MAG: hypothetical protein ACLGH8_05165 [Bacteroidia bacterium]
MNDIHLFYLLKEKAAARYREAYPYYAGSLQQFGNREIAQFIDLLEKDCHTRVSEKWIYTHLKPETNAKLPRKDMLDILCQWLGYGGWDEFVHKNQSAGSSPENIVVKSPVKRKRRLGVTLVSGGILIVFCTALMAVMQKPEITVCYKDKYTQQSVQASQLSVYLIKGNSRQKITASASCYTLKMNDGLLITESAYYKPDTLRLDRNTESKLEIALQPDDYAMMLRAYMNGNVADWNKRRGQLAGIIADDAMIQEVMFDDIGVEFLNKEEFVNKVTVPGTMTKNMEVIEVKYRDNKIVLLKFMQKGK